MYTYAYRHGMISPRAFDMHIVRFMLTTTLIRKCLECAKFDRVLASSIPYYSFCLTAISHCSDN